MSELPTQFEVVVLGRGSGESVLVGIPAVGWVIVDSFVDRREPVALTYLRERHVDLDTVVAVVISHLDADHYIGVDLVLDACENARLYMPFSILGKHFEKLRVKPPGPCFTSVVEAYGRTRREYLRGTLRLDWLKADSRIAEVSDAVVLAPSAAAVASSQDDLTRLISAEVPESEFLSRLASNNTSVVIALHHDGGRVLLTGDLEEEPPEHGWQSARVIADRHALAPAGLLKVPHHGSKTSVLAIDLWALVTDPVTMLVAPKSSHELPTYTMMPMLARHGPVYQAAPSSRKDFNERFRDLAGTLRATPVGHVRAIWDGVAWQVPDPEAPAFCAA